jgi:hypothetical protein
MPGQIIAARQGGDAMRSLRRAVLVAGLLGPLAAGAQTPTAEEAEAAFLAECQEGEGVYVPPGECEAVAQRRRARERARLVAAALTGGSSVEQVAEQYELTAEEALALELEQAGATSE